MRFRLALGLACIAGCVGARTAPVPPPTGAAEREPSAPAAPNFESAVAELRGVRPERLTDDEKAAKSLALDSAWQRLRADPHRAVAALKAEHERLIAAGERDDYFAIEAAHLVFAMSGVREIATLERMYRGVDLAVNFRLAFETLSRMAATRDARVLPTLRAALAVEPGAATVFFAEHVLRVTWPQTIDFIFAPYGPGLCAFAGGEASGSQSHAVVRSAAHLLAVNRCVEGPVILRSLTTSAEPEVATAALRALGVLGVPEDRALIERFASDPRSDVRHSAAFALYELGDPASTPTLRRLLADSEPRVRGEAIAGLFHLVDEDGAAALLAHHRGPAGPAERATIARFVQELAEELEVPAAPLMSADPGAWKNAIAEYWRRRDHFFDLRPGDRALTRRELDAALARWNAAGRIEDEETSWVEHRHVLSVATPADILALLSIRGRVLERHSDEALAEVAILDRLTNVLHRRRVGAKKPNE
jgi:HEAT repeat protein